MTRTYTTREITETKFSALEEISKSINGFIDSNSDYPSVLLLNKSAKRKFEKELATTLGESQLDYYKLNKILQVYGLNVRVAFIDNFTKLPYFELH